MKAAMNLQTIDIYQQRANLNAWFSRKCADSVNVDGVIRGLNCGFGTAAPEKEVAGNRHLLFTELGLDPSGVAYAIQVHGNRVKVVGRGGCYSDVDALVTTKRGLSLAIQVADCAAILLADSHSSVIGAAHAGWRGAVAGIVPGTIETMVETAGARTGRMLAYISPCISQRYFEVGDEVARQFPSAFVDANSFEKPHIDLKGFVRQQLLDSGLADKHIEMDSGCTFRDSSRYYSYRREQEGAGRMSAIIQLV